MHITVVCHGNIARSQVLHRYLDEIAARAGIDLRVSSCGIAPREAYADEARLLAEVQAELSRLGVGGKVARTPWGDVAREQIEASDVVLAADEQCADHVVREMRRDEARMEDAARTKYAGCVELFYEYIGEGRKDFVDTFDSAAGRQDPDRFRCCFDELRRIAESVVDKIGSGGCL